jgi:hypothetical protein
MKELAGIEKVDVTTVRMAYYKTSDAKTAALDQYIQSLRNFDNSWWNWASLYFVGAHDSVEVCNTALRKAGIGRGSEALDVPNWWFSCFCLRPPKQGIQGPQRLTPKYATKRTTERSADEDLAYQETNPIDGGPLGPALSGGLLFSVRPATTAKRTVTKALAARSHNPLFSTHFDTVNGSPGGASKPVEQSQIHPTASNTRIIN